MFATLCSTAALLQYDCTANTTSEPECNKMSSKQTCVERASNETAMISMGVSLLLGRDWGQVGRVGRAVWYFIQVSSFVDLFLARMEGVAH